jgi:hypothetical protein
MRYRIAAALLYLMTLVWFAHRLDGVADWLAIVVIFVLPFAVGVTAGLWALPVPLLVFFLALPAGYGSGEIPIWFVMMFVGLIALPAIVIGWGARWLAARYVLR